MKTFRFRQRLDKRSVADPYTETRREMQQLRFSVRKGQTVAVTASSRGISDIVPITCGVVDHFKESGLKPFIVPAMGSHAGGTAESQRQLLLDYGLTESVLGCPIRSSMETVLLGELQIDPINQVNQIKPVTQIDQIENNRIDFSDTIYRDRIPVYFDRLASEADHVFLVNRIKSHTRFTGSIESGLLKMLMIGLGNADGAGVYHRAVSDDRFSVVIRRVADFLSQKISLLGGLGIVENGEGKTALLKAIHAPDIANEEEKLLILSKSWMPRLPFDEIDLLFIERIGKNISGTGFDSNVVGRKFDDHKALRGEKPVVHCIAVLGLTPETAGNANGIGMAEFCLSSVLREIDWQKTRFNAITARHVSAAMIPLDYETEKEIIEAAWQTLGRPDLNDFRVVWIRDTLHLETITASESFRNKVIESGYEIIETNSK
ncbi:MAG: DUF362 domain-containing protein [Planctomycetaceae bacterium]|jgi:hypothetical protein|nr:DUF362 domain-containing protein [Planctomycetaceae bacterium]